ncbi:hypothetical protein F183_A27020 [Bryobacterales bacterium F-183]|nr:hypothetical protein F183_A27020 [Bryobacterales bacterium F-183]
MLAGALFAQQQGVVGTSVRVYTEGASGARFMVDGLTYFGSQTFTWPHGSKHVIEFPLKVRVDGSFENYQESLDKQSQFSFSGWQDSTGNTYGGFSQITFVADGIATFVKGGTSPAHRVSLRFSTFPSNPTCTPFGPIPQDSVRTGFVLMGGSCFGADADTFLPAGPTTLTAIPFPGSVFLNWSINGSVSTGASRTFNLAGPVTIAAQFTTSKRVQFLTEPRGLNVLVDRSPTPTSGTFTLADDALTRGNPTCQSNLNLPPNPPVTIPVLCYGEFDFVPGSRHTIGAPSPQYTPEGQMVVFDKFDNGLGDNAVFIASTDLSKRDILTAKFVQGYNASFLTNPPNLKLSIDDRDTLFLNYNFAWGVGHTHWVSAPLEQRDSNGRLWRFKRWSNDGPARQMLTVNGPIRLTAEYEAQPQLVITSNPPGLSLRVDGANCATPCTLDRAPGAQVRVMAPQTISITPQSRYELIGWNDGEASERMVTFDTDRQVYQAIYRITHQLSAVSDPANGVTFTFDPPGTEGFYSSDAAVTVRAEVKNGYKFRRWEGDLAGTFQQGTLVMNAPRSVLARLDKVPFIPPAGIRNAAGETPDGVVAPGSLISILGESLAAGYQAGRPVPLQQAIGDVTVRIGESLLPLVSVSPTEVRAQLLSTIGEGDRELRVKWGSNPEVVGKFTVARNAPGLFTRDDQPIALATHEDGSAITQQSPARRGEVVTLFGTGFGPYQSLVLDGFPHVTGGANLVVDPVDLLSGERLFVPEFTGASPSLVGITIARFRVPQDVEGNVLPLVARVNGRLSNTVELPVE